MALLIRSGKLNYIVIIALSKTIHLLLGATNINGRKLDETAMETVHFIKFMDNLFDSVNASTLPAIDIKPLKCTVSSNTQHLKFWHTAKKCLATMYFRDSKGKRTTPPSNNNWTGTLDSIEAIYHYVQSTYGVPFLRTRQLKSGSY